MHLADRRFVAAAEVEPGLRPSKPLHRSLTARGALVVVLSTMIPPIVLLAGLPPEPAQAVEFLGQLGNLAGAAIVVWGRLRARQSIG
jgi:hypothetical protein